MGAKMRDSPRLFINFPLKFGADITLCKEHTHYIHNVMRLKEGDKITVFNGEDGEYLANIKTASKKSVQIVLEEKIHGQEILPDFTLFFAPIKGHRNDNIVEKATELGIANLNPVLTERTIVRKINIEKYRLTTIEAAEQCERLNIPNIHELTYLVTAVDNFEGKILFADEAGGGQSIATALPEKPQKIAFLVGPEGGFSPKEREFLLSHTNVIPVHFGRRILRADTAAIAGLILLQTFYGDF
jgi:16S rRNA (uracil1498-N3)-methyltransferase